MTTREKAEEITNKHLEEWIADFVDYLNLSKDDRNQIRFKVYSACNEMADWVIDYACKWLKSRISVDASIETNENGEPLMGNLLDIQTERLKLAEEFIENFRQAMKG